MKICLFYHSLVSDWNHGNAHFLRGVASELVARNHEVCVYEPIHGWSVTNLIESHGLAPLHQFQTAYPHLSSISYDLNEIDLESEIADADVVIVHEWNDHELVRRIGQLRKKRSFALLFHDTHHRLITEPESMRNYDLGHYDGVLAFGNVLRDLYISRRLTGRAWTWHEAADVRQFHPLPEIQKDSDLVWIGNWGDDERSAELHEFLIEPAKSLGLRTNVYGVRYPDHARKALGDAGIHYHGWLPNFDAPSVFARHQLTIHVPRRPYVAALPGIPTIRPFEALACGIPLISAPWNDAEDLFSPGLDYLVARDGTEMKKHITSLLNDTSLRDSMAEHGLMTIAARHTCAHRTNELLHIVRELSSIRQIRPCHEPAFDGKH